MMIIAAGISMSLIMMIAIMKNICRISMIFDSIF